MSRSPEHQFESMVQQSVEYQREWRKSNTRMYEFYDGVQWSHEDLLVLQDRGQHPTVINLCRAQVDMIAAIQIESEADMVLVGRESGDEERAGDFTALLRQVEDHSRYRFQRNNSFIDGLKGGVGWIHTGVKDNQIWVRRRPWHEIYWDPYAVDPCMVDARFIARQYWMDRDQAKKQWPKMAEEIENLDSDKYGPQQDDFDSQEKDVQATLSNKPLITIGPNGRRIRITDHWYRDEQDEIHRVQYAGPLFLEGSADGKNPSPFDDKDVYPFIPFCAFRDRHGNPMGIIAFISSLQELLNKVNSKYLHTLSSYTALFEQGAVDDIDELRQQLARPDSAIIVADGALSSKRVEITKQASELVHLRDMVQLYIGMIQRVTGVNDALLGFGGTNARSAIQESSRNAQGTAMQTSIMDSFAATNQRISEVMVKLIGQFYNDKTQVRILGTNTGTAEFRGFNTPQPTAVIDTETGDVLGFGEPKKTSIKDILRYDVIFKRVTPFTSIREHQLSMIVEVIKAGVLPPQVAAPLVIQNLDLPGKEEILQQLQEAMQPQEPVGQPPQMAAGY